MREIKFRGKTTKYGFVKGCLIYCKKHPEKPIIQSTDCESPLVVTSYYIDPKTIGEYLGRNDKHNNEIYEGDFVKDQNGSTWEVKFNDEHPYWIPFIFPLNEAPELFEVVGNKWDNPELAKEV